MSYVKVAKAPESAMKTISFVLMEDLLCHFLHSTQLEDKHYNAYNSIALSVLSSLTDMVLIYHLTRDGYHMD